MIYAQGLRPHPDKVFAIQQAPTIESVMQLNAYLGLITYYGKFLPNLSTLLAPLYKLLGKVIPWKWSAEQDKAFKVYKELLTSSQLFVHFNPQLPLLMACDASVYGNRAVLAHKCPTGQRNLSVMSHAR